MSIVLAALPHQLFGRRATLVDSGSSRAPDAGSSCRAGKPAPSVPQGQVRLERRFGHHLTSSWMVTTAARSIPPGRVGSLAWPGAAVTHPRTDEKGLKVSPERRRAKLTALTSWIYSPNAPEVKLHRLDVVEYPSRSHGACGRADLDKRYCTY